MFTEVIQTVIPNSVTLYVRVNSYACYHHHCLSRRHHNLLSIYILLHTHLNTHAHTQSFSVLLPHDGAIHPRPHVYDDGSNVEKWWLVPHTVKSIKLTYRKYCRVAAAFVVVAPLHCIRINVYMCVCVASRLMLGLC